MPIERTNRDYNQPQSHVGNHESNDDPRGIVLPEAFGGLAVLRLEFVLRAEESTTLPSFLGSTLRGAFGHALKRTACQATGAPCTICPIPQHCWYGWLFETETPDYATDVAAQRDAPRPFILTPPLEDQTGNGRSVKRGETISFAMSLFGGAVNGLPYAVLSIEEMARRGLGVQRGWFALQDVYCLDRLGNRISLDYDPKHKQFDLLKSETCYADELMQDRLAQIPASDRVKLRFLTRARIRVQGNLQGDLDFSTLIRFLWRRTSLMLAVHGNGLPSIDKNAMLRRADEVKTLASAWIKHEVWRSSNRQRRRLHQDGFLGEIVFEGPGLKRFLPLLAAGELLHVGSGATFGLGKYEIVV